jgi:hypothetical protein
MRNMYNILDGKHEGKKPLSISTHGWEGSVRMILREI